MTRERAVATLALDLADALDPAEPAAVQLTALADEVRNQARQWRGTVAETALRDLAVALDRLAEEVGS